MAVVAVVRAAISPVTSGQQLSRALLVWISSNCRPILRRGLIEVAVGSHRKRI
ncbi:MULTISPECIES: hypothetical protein [unclassified Bradyrhizobium]